MKWMWPCPAVIRRCSTPPRAAPNNFGSCLARFTPRPTALNPKNSAAACSLSLRRTPPRPIPLLRKTCFPPRSDTFSRRDHPSHKQKRPLPQPLQVHKPCLQTSVTLSLLASPSSLLPLLFGFSFLFSLLTFSLCSLRPLCTAFTPARSGRPLR